MTTPFLMTKDIGGYNGFGLPLSDTNYEVTLVASTDTSLAIPETFNIGSSSSTKNAKLIAIITSDSGSSVWVANNATAVIPSSGSFAATTSCLNPAAIEVKGGDTLHFISSGTPNVSVRLYWLFS